MADFSEKEIEKLDRASDLLVAANRPLNVLQAIDWPGTVATEFFEKNAQELPKVAYKKMKMKASVEALQEAHQLIDGSSLVHEWLGRVANKISETVLLLRNMGQPGFFEHSKNLFGTPEALLWDGKHTALDLAQQQDIILSRFNHCDLVDHEPTVYTAAEVRKLMRPKIKNYFGDQAPRIRLVDDLSAKAKAGSKVIKLRTSAPFTDLDARQLLMHEAYVHIATSLNGKQQEKFKVLGSGHAGTTKTQEGLAVFSEIIGGVMDPVRMQRLSDRVLGIQMSIEGADFLDVYQFYLERSHNEFEAFENTRRIFRGGVLTGGAPLTKDGVYLEGLLRVHNFLQITIPTGNMMFLDILLCGKMDLDDVEALMMLYEQKLLSPPKFRPPWAHDMRFLASMLSYSQFLNRIDFAAVHEKYEGLLQRERIV